MGHKRVPLNDKLQTMMTTTKRMTRTQRRQVHRRYCASARHRTRRNSTCGYDCALGEGISRDPIDELGGENLYGFVFNSSPNGVDLFGLSCRKWFGWQTGGSTPLWPGTYAAWDLGVEADKCDADDAPMPVWGCTECVRLHVAASAEFGVGWKYNRRGGWSIWGVGFRYSFTAEATLAKLGANGETTIWVCPGPLGMTVDHDSSVIRLVDFTFGPTFSGSVSGGVHAGRNVSVDVYGSLSLYANLHATLGVRVQSNYGQGTIDAVGSFTGNAGVKGKAYARASIYGLYFDKLFFEFDETMFDKPLWADEVALANIYRW